MTRMQIVKIKMDLLIVHAKKDTMEMVSTVQVNVNQYTLVVAN